MQKIFKKPDLKNPNNLIGLAILFWISFVSIEYFIDYIFVPHSSVGEWKDKNPNSNLKLLIFNDKTAIVDDKYLRMSCSWSEKENNMIVLSCSSGMNKKSAEQIVIFKIDASKSTSVGYFDYYLDGIREMIRVLN